MPDTSHAQLKRLGVAIRAARTALGLSQEKFGEKCDLDRTYIGEIERGEKNVSFQNIARISRALHLKTSALLIRAGI